MEHRMRFGKNEVEEKLDRLFSSHAGRRDRGNSFATETSNKKFSTFTSDSLDRNVGSNQKNSKDFNYYHGPKRLDNNFSDEQRARPYRYNDRNLGNIHRNNMAVFPDRFINEHEFRTDSTQTVIYETHAHTAKVDKWLPHSQSCEELPRYDSFQRSPNFYDNLEPSTPIICNLKSFARHRMDTNNVDDILQGNSISKDANSSAHLHNRDSFRRENERNRRIFRRNSNERQRVKKLDDGFICVTNPDYSADYDRKNHVDQSRKIRSIEHNRSYVDFTNNQRRSQNTSSSNGRPRKSRSPKPYKRETHEKFKNEKNNQTDYRPKVTRKEILKRNSRGKDALKKPLKANEKHEENNFAKYHWSKAGYIPISNTLYKITEELPNKSDQLELKKTTAPKNSKEIPSTTKNESKSTVPANMPKTMEKKMPRKERKKIYLQKIIKSKKKQIKDYKKHNLRMKAKIKELKEEGITIGRIPDEGHLKYEPEKYWTTWWSKYAYVENVIEEVSYNDETLQQLMKFKYDLNDQNLDSKVKDIYGTGIRVIHQTSNINEINYDSREDVYFALKNIKILEDKEFQSFLLTKELIYLNKILEDERANKIKQALLYQSIIAKWHIFSCFIKSGDISSTEKVKKAENLLGCKLFLYFVLDSIYKLKKLTAEDWPDFDKFYENLK